MEIKLVLSKESVTSSATFEGTRNEFLDLEWIDSQSMLWNIDIAKVTTLEDVLAQNPTGLILFQFGLKFFSEGESQFQEKLFWIEDGVVLKSEVTNA